MTATFIVAAVLMYLAGACLLGAYLRRSRRQSYRLPRQDAPLEPEPPQAEPPRSQATLQQLREETPPPHGGVRHSGQQIATSRRERG